MVTQADLMLLLGQGTESQSLEMMITNAKKRYVKEHHHRAISQMTNATGYKKDKWKTYVIGDGNKRKEIIRNTEDELYAALYDHYFALDNRIKTLTDVFELLKQYKQEALARSYHTVFEDIRRFNMISDKLKMKPINEISDIDIRTWLTNDFLRAEKKQKVSSLRKQLQLFSQIFEYGIRNKYCFDNPTRYIAVNDYLKFCDVSQKADEEKEFSEDELLKIREDCWKETKNPRALMTLVSSETGLRAGELPALLKSDDCGDYLHVHRQQLLDKNEDGNLIYPEVEYTKDERMHPHNGRLVPITPECRKALDLAKELCGESEYIFHDKKGSPIRRDSYMQNLLRRCRRLGVGPTHNHAFRVAFNSRLIELGLSAADRALILGHEVQTNEAHYSVSDKRRIGSIMERMSEKNYVTEKSIGKANNTDDYVPAE